jgi:predicted nucleic acid-binding protein
MAANVLVDAGFLVAILAERDSNHRWAAAIASQYPPPWKTCGAVLSEAFYILGEQRIASLIAMVKRTAVVCPFRLEDNTDHVLGLIGKYADVPISFADACLVRMTETMPDPVLLTTDADFRIYRRHSRHVVPCVTPP